MNNTERETIIRKACKRAQKKGLVIASAPLPSVSKICPMQAVAGVVDGYFIKSAVVLETDENWTMSFARGFDGLRVDNSDPIGAYKLGQKIRGDLLAK